jgi:hypothetical protein
MDERLGEGWTVTDDLLALLIEVSSVTASGRQLKKPIEVPRPDVSKPAKAAASAPAGGRVDVKDAAFKKGIAVLSASSKSVRG